MQYASARLQADGEVVEMSTMLDAERSRDALTSQDLARSLATPHDDDNDDMMMDQDTSGVRA